ncbi:MAG TPA: hypothetical protein PLX41_01365 [Bacteroidales bacterium]|nr:hypothetical protein [Bacteroidales bacterium]HPR72285.1 hypothetical protein [Bacteroidales bacterium]
MKMNRRGLILFFILANAITGLNGQDISITTAFDSTEIYLGDQIYFTIKVEQPSGLKLDVQQFSDTITKNIEIISGPYSDTTSTPDDRLKIINKYLITSFDSGFYMVPPVYAGISDGTGMKRFYSDYSQLQVRRFNTAPADTTALIYDITEPYRAPITVGELLPWFLMAALAGLLGYGIFLLIRRLRKDEEEMTLPKPTEPAHVIAFRELKKLQENEIWQKGEIKKYYSCLTEIVRQYIENRFGIYALEMTTSETLAALIRSGLKKNESYSVLESVLIASDLVKFAKYQPQASDNENHFSNVWKFVEDTAEEEKSTEAVSIKKEKEGGAE